MALALSASENSQLWKIALYGRRIKQIKSNCKDTKRFKSKYKKGYMIDKVRVYARGGAGGQGSSTRGGTGGDGGDVIVRAEKCNLSDLARRESRRFVAGTGQNSSLRVIIGKKGNSLIIPVPPGTAIMDGSGKHQLYDLDTIGSEVTLVRGGRGGCVDTPNWSGSRGEMITVNLVLKLIADVGMVGFPNAGKSTLLGAISNASPKVADYPFTTIRPHLGYVNSVHNDRLEQFTVADLPGLVEGAHSNVGMGHRFLRHIERTRVLLFVVDITGFRLSHKTLHRSAFETVQLLTKELELYQSGLSTKPCVLAVNKMDLAGANALLSSLQSSLECDKDGMIPNFLHVLPISAENGLRIEELKVALNDTLASHKDTTQVPACCENSVES
jgi:Obg family GTPase CgtA